jgi:hypothetical protein
VLVAGIAGYLASATVIQAVLSRRVRPALIWPGLGVPLILLAGSLDLAPPVQVAAMALILVTGVATGIAQHRAGEIRTART